MARKRAPQHIIEAIQQETQLTPRECAQALRVNDVWFRTLITTDHLPSVPALTTFFTSTFSEPPNTNALIENSSHANFSRLALTSPCTHISNGFVLARSRCSVNECSLY
jgi:hypothetical protein